MVAATLVIQPITTDEAKHFQCGAKPTTGRKDKHKIGYPTAEGTQGSQEQKAVLWSPVEDWRTLGARSVHGIGHPCVSAGAYGTGSSPPRDCFPSKWCSQVFEKDLSDCKLAGV